jgi:phage terminase small subunit
MNLTHRQETFAQLVASGKSQSEAYRLAYPKSQRWKDQSVWAKASALMQADKVSIRVDAICAELARQGLWDRKQAVKVLVAIVQDKERAAADRIKAVCELNKMHGFHAPEKHELSGPGGSPIQLSDVERAAKIKAILAAAEHRMGDGSHTGPRHGPWRA